MKSINKHLPICKYFWFVFLICLVNSPIQSQTFSQKQMQDDLSFLQEYIHQYFFPLALLEQRTGINVDNEFKKLSDEITSTTSIEDFTQIVRQGLNILNDAHSQIIPGFSLVDSVSPDYYLSSIGNVSLADTTNADYYYRLLNQMSGKVKINIMTKYMNGEYYNIRPFMYNGIRIDAGEKIDSINGIPMNQFVGDNSTKMYYLCWDPSSQKYYSRSFPMALPLLGIDKFTLNIGGNQITLSLDTTVETLQERHSQTNYGNMMLIDNNILYIRMPAMSDREWYISELLRMYTPNIEKIIFDVRGNSGGYDGVWIDLLRKIIDKPLEYKYHVGMNHNQDIENSILSSFSELKMIRKEDKTGMYRQTLHFPDSNSVHFNGKMYVLQDEFTYSAAAALASVALQNENMEVVGTPSAMIGGYTLPAIAFKLPNSGIVFTLAFSADLTGGEKNPYMDKVEVEILENDIDVFVDKMLNYDYYSEEYLLNKDKLIKYVREN